MADVESARSSPASSSPAFPGSAKRSRPRSRWLHSLGSDIDPAYSDVPILICCAVSALCDTVAFNACGVFVSMQTGNSVFLALGAAQLPDGQPILWLKSLCSIVAFWAGCFAFSQLRRVGPLRKGTLSASFLIQAAFIFIAAALAQSQAVPEFGLASLHATASSSSPAPSENTRVLAPIMVLAFQFGGQIVMSRTLGFNEVPTNVLTSLYCDLWSDPNLLAPWGKNAKRNRRVMAVVLFFVGGISGGWLQRTSGGMSCVLWIAGAIKISIATAWALWRSKSVAAAKV